MKIATRDILYNEISRFNPVTLRIKPGEVFQIETELNTGDWLQNENDQWSPEKATWRNPTSGCIYIEEATAKDVLAIKIKNIELSNIGYTALIPRCTPFPDWIRKKDWGGVISKTVKIENDHVYWSKNLKIPIQPMIGFVGTAPDIGSYPNSDNGKYGGNLDIQEVTIGNTIFLPVYVDGALLHVGDVHAIMGDGEICCAGGIETRSILTIQVDLIPKPQEMIWPRIETPESIISIGCARPAEDAFRIAVQELINWMVGSFGFTDTEAFLLLGQVMQARCTQFVDPLYTYIAKIEKKYLKPEK
ncbi:MAG: acetamidase/formamidase family protein [Atribacterota bacterium]|nr:acetamidase/formamidase family protein [Atribacterota bacterium]